ncbi:MAG TPA: BatA and WFA domain-containing protein, partial [bacterium]|nr:BatA and WFA domain-containing protein [bacterium]
MTFLNPWFLIGLLGTSIPIVIHLLNLRTARRVDFSTLEFLRKIERKSLRRVRVRQLLLLLLRMLIIASVAIAMARPALTGLGSGGGNGSVAAAIVLDASLSMRAMAGEKTVFDWAREKALSLVESLSDGDEVFLFLPGAANENRFEGIHDLGLVRDRITAAEPGLGPGNLDTAVREAGRILATARHPNREIHVLSDFQRASWTEPQNATPLPEHMRLYLLPVAAQDVSNAWV